MSGFLYERDSEGIVTVIMDMPGEPVNVMNDEYVGYMAETLIRLESEIDCISGVVLISGKNTYFAGGDLDKLLNIDQENAEGFFIFVEEIKQQLRRLEKLPVPVVAAINGAALGGGYEICLACNHRIIINDAKAVVGLTEVNLGLMPGCGGIVRLVRLLGLEAALPYLLEGKQVGSETALAAGMIDDVIYTDNRQVLIDKAKEWIKQNPGVVQPWDNEGYNIPGGSAADSNIRQLLGIAPAGLQKKTRGLLPAQEHILAVAAEGCLVDIDTALRIESRSFVHLATSTVAKNIITTCFFQKKQIKNGAARPEGVARSTVKKLGVLGAGMMGQGIAYASAVAGIQVVLKDIDLETAEKGKVYADKLLTRLANRGRVEEEEKTRILDLIKPVDNITELTDCDLLIEAVFEDLRLKEGIISEAGSLLKGNAIFASNTSSLPITYLAESHTNQKNFIGIHFFSPVEKMHLVEIIVGKHTSNTTLARSFDYVRQLDKIPIVVNDRRGFFTSRVFYSYLDEGARMLTEGVDPVLIENLAMHAGMPVGPLAVHDEVSLKLTSNVSDAHRELDKMFGNEEQLSNHTAVEVARQMFQRLNRGGRYYGGGFYEYHEGDSKTLWPGLYEIYPRSDGSVPEQDIMDRLLFRQVLESLRCLQEGVLRSAKDGNIGSIMGIGFPIHTGGVFQYINAYGIDKFYDRTQELYNKYGEPFKPPDLLKEKVGSRIGFY